MKKIVRRSKSGFTLAETLIAIVLLLFVSGLLAEGVPLAVNAYRKVTEASNAHVLLSTTLTELRDKLAFSSDITINGTEVRFTSSNGRGYVLSNKDSGELKGIYLDDAMTMAEGVEDDSRLLVSNEAAAKTLYAKYDSVTISNKIITFNNLGVYRKSDNNEFVKVEKYDVKLMN